ncbi:kielin/chordin-like protein [Argopecten irradians]|uniref:kielin/chordin-like protein n=1 Tax=Argopecten irradians TaxID=31199 RepID=UPI00371DCBF6
MAILLLFVIAAVNFYGSNAVSPPFPTSQSFPFPGNPGIADPRCPPTGRFGICAFTCSSGSCGQGRICCPTACGGTTCSTPVSPPVPAPISPPCPEGVPMPFCTFVPCEREMCPNHPSAKCVDNYCGGCNARFYLNGRDVTKTCKKIVPSPRTCPNGKPRVNCLINPCRSQSCPRLPRATCVADYCGGCKARFYLHGQEVTKTCQIVAPPPTICDNGLPPVNCLVNPCSVQQCPLIPNAKCVADYCGGCNAKFFVNGNEVTQMCRRRRPFYFFK